MISNLNEPELIRRPRSIRVDFSRPCGSAAQRRNKHTVLLGRAAPSQPLLRGDVGKPGFPRPLLGGCALPTPPAGGGMGEPGSSMVTLAGSDASGEPLGGSGGEERPMRRQGLGVEGLQVRHQRQHLIARKAARIKDQVGARNAGSVLSGCP